MSLPEPYYSRDGIVIYHGDCRAILPHLDPVDLVCTDPPYGIGAGRQSFGMWRTSRMPEEGWDDVPAPDDAIRLAVAAGSRSILWGGNYFALPPSRMFLMWDKGAGFKGRDFAECEQAWCSWDGNARIFRHDPLASGDYREKQHRTQKPVPLMKWCIQQAGDDIETIGDPFGGVGTTLIAARDLGKKAWMIEIEERYCEIAVNRLSQQLLPFA